MVDTNKGMLKSGPQGWMSDCDGTKSGKGGDVGDLLSKANDRAMMKDPGRSPNPGVDKGFWAKADDKALTKTY